MVAAETGGGRKPWEVDDGLWERIEPLLPVVERRFRHPGRRRLDDRRVLCGILFVLYTGIPWRCLPKELGFGSGVTCWRRLRDWNDAGVWQKLHELLLAELRAAGMLDFSRAAVDGSHVRAMKGGAPGRGRGRRNTGVPTERPRRHASTPRPRTLPVRLREPSNTESGRAAPDGPPGAFPAARSECPRALVRR